LRVLRVLAGRSAEEVAAAAHVSVATYLRWEGGQVHQLPDPTFGALATALGVEAGAVRDALDEL